MFIIPVLVLPFFGVMVSLSVGSGACVFVAECDPSAPYRRALKVIRW